MDPASISPVTVLLSLVPAKYRPYVECVLSLLAIVSTVVALLPSSASKYRVVKALRFIGGLVHSDEPGTLKIPMTNVVLRIGASKVEPSPVVVPAVEGQSAK